MENIILKQWLSCIVEQTGLAKMNKLPLKPFTLVAGILAGIQSIIELWGCIDTPFRLDFYFLRFGVCPTLAWGSLALFLMVLYSKQK